MNGFKGSGGGGDPMGERPLAGWRVGGFEGRRACESFQFPGSHRPGSTIQCVRESVLEAWMPPLFEHLPEHTAPTASPGGAPRLRRPDRDQMILAPGSLNDMLPADHQVRVVEA